VGELAGAPDQVHSESVKFQVGNNNNGAPANAVDIADPHELNLTGLENDEIRVS
jgi:hypothetical protein